MPGDRAFAAWLVAQRRATEEALAARLGKKLPARSAPESEALRRFRTFAARAVLTGATTTPALDGLRASERSVAALLEAWIEAAAQIAGPRADEVRTTLEPLARRFCSSLRDTAPARRKSGTPRASGRAVRAAIDRVADGYLAIDVDTRTIVDANPAAGALLGAERDTLLGADADGYLPEAGREGFWTQLDALCESDETRRFPTWLRDQSGSLVSVEVSLTRYARRTRTLALALLRPRDGLSTS